MNLQDFLSRLDGVKGHNNQYSAKCPAHDDHNASLSVSTGKDGKIIMKCHAGCEVKDILFSLGLVEKDLFQREYKAPQQKKWELVARYNYTDENGRSLFQKTRWNTAEGKTFTWNHQDNSGHWQKGRGGRKTVLYNLQEVAGADTVYLVEGEKDVETLKKVQLVATSSPDGAGGNWQPSYTEALKGKTVYIIQDNDTPGKAFARKAAEALYGAAKQIKVIDLTEDWDKLPEHGDATDAYNLTPQDFKGKLEALTITTPDFEPGAEPQEKCGWELVHGNEIEVLPINWTMKPYLEQGTIVLIQGDNGTGKTYLACALAACITTGTPILNEVFVQEPGNVVFLSMEDDKNTLVNRIQLSGGDASKCVFPTIPEDEEITFLSPDIERAIRDKKAKAIIFDPFQFFLGSGVDMHRANETRPILSKVVSMCKRHNCVCIIIAHTGKDVLGKSLVNQALGSVDIPAITRSIIHAVKNPADPSEVIAIHAKCSHARPARALVYSIGESGLTFRRFEDITERDLQTMQRKQDQPSNLPYEINPLVKVFQHIKRGLTGDQFIPYAEFDSICSKVIRSRPYTSSRDLGEKIKALSGDLQEKEQIIVTAGAKGRGNIRGIRVEPFFDVIEESEDFPGYEIIEENCTFEDVITAVETKTEKINGLTLL